MDRFYGSLTAGLARLPTAVLALPVAGAYLLHVLSQPEHWLDDAYIFFRYAANWADGHGPVFNPGERVEGYSSVLWTMILAAGAALSIEPERFAPVMATGFGLLCIGLTCYLTRRLIPSSPLLWLGVPLAVAMSSGLALFAVVGMDTVIFTFAILASTAAAIDATRSGRIEWLAATLVFLSLARAEGPLYVVSLLLVLASQSFTSRNNLGPRAVLQLTALCAVALFAQAALRFAYYGDLIPNTVSAKGYATHGLVDVVSSGFRNWHDLIDAVSHGVQYQRAFIAIAILPVVVLALRSLSRRSTTAGLWLVAAPIVVNIGITVWSSGDWIGLQRLNVPVWPLVLILVACQLEWLTSKLGRVWGWAAAPAVGTGIILLAMFLLGSSAVERRPGLPRLDNLLAPDETGWSLYGHQTGDFLRETGYQLVLLSDVVGKLPYYAGPNVYVRDAYGLTDEHNGEDGDRWTRTLGRSDDAYNFGEPFDLLVTNDPDFLRRLLDYWDAEDSAEVGDRYVFFQSNDWLRENFFVLALETHPIAGRLTAFCTCTASALTRDMVEQMEPPGR